MSTELGEGHIAFGYWTWKHLRGNFALAPQVAVVGAVVVFAQLLIVHNQLRVQASEIEDNRSTAAAEAERKKLADETAKKEMEKSSPEYLERKVRTWVEREGYSTQHISPKQNQAFHVLAERDKFLFHIIQEKDSDGMTFVILNMQGAAKLSQLSLAKKIRLREIVELELLRHRIQFAVVYGKDNSMVELRDQFHFDRYTSRADFIERLFLLQTKIGMVEILTKQFFRHPGL